MARRPPSRSPALLAAVAILAAACTSPGGDDETGSRDDRVAPTGGEFSLASGEPSFLAPTSRCVESDCAQIVNTVNTGLLTIDPGTAEQRLDMAESIQSDDGRVWTVKIKDGWTLHNGEPVDAGSFADAWNYAAYGPNATPLGSFFSRVQGFDDMQGESPEAEVLSGVAVVNDTTIEITLTERFSQWPLVMSHTPAFAPVAQECLADLDACNEKPIGNGPYQMVRQWDHSSITLERFEDYKGDNVGNADTIEFKIYSDRTTPFKDWQAGDVDIVAPDPTQYPQAQVLADGRILEVDRGDFAYFGYPLYVEQFQDIRIRQALSLAVNRERISERVFSGTVATAGDVIAPFALGSRSYACEYCAFDPQEARRLYDEAGGLPGEQLTIWFDADDGHERLVQAVAKGWRNVLGVDCEVESLPLTPYLTTLGEFGANGPFLLSWRPEYPSPQNYLAPVYGEDSPRYERWTGPEFEQFLELIANGDMAGNVQEGVSSYQAAANAVLEQMIVIPCGSPRPRSCTRTM